MKCYQYLQIMIGKEVSPSFLLTEDSEVKLAREKSEVQQRRIETLESEARPHWDRMRSKQQDVEVS